MINIPNLPSQNKIKSVAVLTSGGDAPGMNAAIRAVVRYGISHKIQVYGVGRGYTGLLEGDIVKMEAGSVSNIIQRGGTILKTSRCPAFHKRAVRKEAANILRRKGIDGLVVIGGDGSFTGAHLLEQENDFPCIGVPGTIDNDIYGSDDTIGFDTAINTAVSSIDKIRDTASSHDRIFMVEVMGRSCGYIAIETGMGGGAETILVPEIKESIASICADIDHGVKRGKNSSLIVVAEGAQRGGAQKIAQELEKRGHKPKVCILGHTQRGGSPTAHDRLLASVLGASSMAYLLAGESDSMVGVCKGDVVLVPFGKVLGHKKTLTPEIMRLAKILAF